MTRHNCHLTKLVLTNFRNYQYLNLESEQAPVVITGPNGSGKTNILEAISFLSPGRGLRNIKLNIADNMCKTGTSNSWTILSNVKNGFEETIIGTARDKNSLKNKRLIKIDGEKIKNQSELTSCFSVMWQTPQMDGLFIGPGSERRKFLDRLVYNFDSEHISRIYSYEYSMRERLKLLQNNGDATWINLLETKMAEKGIAITAARLEVINIIQNSIDDAPSHFPKAKISISGKLEDIFMESDTSIEAENKFKEELFSIRQKDIISSRSNIGANKTDFEVYHIEKQMPAKFCSTGEQKALLLSIILAEARAKTKFKGSSPVILLDEVVAHLDENRRSSLYEVLIDLGAQVWMTGTDKNLFKSLKNKAQFLSIKDGLLS